MIYILVYNPLPALDPIVTNYSLGSYSCSRILNLVLSKVHLVHHAVRILRSNHPLDGVALLPKCVRLHLLRECHRVQRSEP